MIYAWNGKEVLEIGDHTWRKDYRLDGLHCVDTSEDTPEFKYGKPIKVGRTMHWLEYSFDEFPNKFKTALLLLGVT